jgi:hypothetical protein
MAEIQMDYRPMLEESYAVVCDHSGQQMTRLGYLADYIFDFTTYDSAMGELFASKALEVCEAVSDGKTFEYIEDPENYKWYLLMCNMPFFDGRLEWGTSIRGAWWDYGGTEFDTCGLWLNGKQITDTMKFSAPMWRDFIAALLSFGRETACANLATET